MPKKIEYEVIDGIEHKKCTGECGELKSLSEFGTYHVKDKLYYRSECKECLRKIDAEKAKVKRADPEKNAKINAQRRERNSTEERKAIIKAQHSTPEYLARDAELQRMRRADPIKGAKIADQQIERLKDPVKREIKNAAQRIENMTPEEIEKKNAYERERRKDPDVKTQKKEYDRRPENRFRNIMYLRERRINPDKRALVLAWDAKHAYAKMARGCEPLNEWFEGCERHHLWTDEFGSHDPNTVVCIPKEPHQGIDHCGDVIEGKCNQRPSDGMIEITEFAYLWYSDNYTYDQYNINKLKTILEATKQRVANGWENATGWNEYQEIKTTLINKKQKQN